MHNPDRINRYPDSVEYFIIWWCTSFKMNLLISKVELRLFTLNKQIKNLGVYSLITSFVETDKGSVEMIYDEGFRGDRFSFKSFVFSNW